MNRRSFLQAMGLGSGATALAACGLDDNRYYTPVEKLLPYITHPIQTTPGTPSFFATSVGTGPRAWPVVSIHREGRVVNVGANVHAHLKQNHTRNARTELRTPRAVPSSQFFDLQRHYSPDRITTPQRGGAPIHWEEAMTEVTAAATRARAAGKRIAYLGPYTSATLPYLLKQVADQALFWEPLGLENELLAARSLLGTDVLPRYDLASAEYVLSFGAPFLSDAWGSAQHQADFARGRDANVGGFVTRFAAVTPLRDQTAANADEWYACNPGTEAQVALAVAKVVARRRSYIGPGQEILDRGDIAAAAASSGLTEKQINEIADRFASGGAVALPGGVAGASRQGTVLAGITYLLNIVSGARDLFMSGGYPGPINTFAEVERLIADMNAGRIGLLLLGDLDAVHLLPNSESLLTALEKVDLSVAVTSYPSATTAAAKLVLPTHSVFEDWGDEEPIVGLRLVRQPGMVPLYDTRSLGDVALDIWRAVDAAKAPTGTWHDYLMARWSVDVFPNASLPGSGPEKVEALDELPARNPNPPTPGPDFLGFWEGWLSDGFVLTRTTPSPLRPVGSLALERSAPLDSTEGITGDHEYDLLVFAHPFQLDGRYANEPWAQETPDPMTGHVWDTWALVHPDTAARLGVGDNHTIRIQTKTGTIEVGVEVHPCVKPNVIAVPLGGGHATDKGRYAGGVGQNIRTVLKAAKDPYGALAWQQTRCKVDSINRPADLHSTFGVYPRSYAPGSDLTDDSDADRNFVALVPAVAWAEHGDAPSDHPGELTGIHHLPMDERLQNARILDFYDLPDHPTYRFGMAIDTNACNGCGACAVACYAENNLPVVGKEKVKQGREMGWLRINRYFKQHNDDPRSPSVHFVPMLCQHCGHAPCESVCPVLATYHNIDGLNAMIYNRCVGTRYCSNACPYSVRKFNYHSYVWPEPFQLQLNPDVSTRTMGVMEKCTFCIQRIRRTKSAYRDDGDFSATVPDAALEQLTACAEACPSQAITFGNLKDEDSGPSKARKSVRNYIPIAEINTFPAINYLARASFHFELEAHGKPAGGGHERDPNHAAPPGADGH